MELWLILFPKNLIGRKFKRGEFMINFIVCDDNLRDLNKTVKIVDKVMMANDIKYNVHTFNDYDNVFLKFISKKMCNKVYLLDIEMPTRSGIDVARIIRNRDSNSILMFLTGHQDYDKVILKGYFLHLSFVNKYNNFELKLTNALNQALKVINQKKTFMFKDNNTIFKLDYNDILYITRDSITRKTIIKLDYGEFNINMPISKLAELLSCDFVKTHRACYINKNRVCAYKKSERMVFFDNGDTVDIISTRFKGELV